MGNSQQKLELEEDVYITQGDRFSVLEIQPSILPIPCPMEDTDCAGDTLVVIGFKDTRGRNIVRLKYDCETGHWENRGHETPAKNISRALQRGLIQREE